MKNKFAALLAIMFLGWSGTALADECDDLGKNPEWKTGSAQLKAAFEAGDYDAVLAKGEELNYICARSPETNYYIGASYAAKGDLENAKVYLEIAGESTYEFATTPELSRQIFYARYEAENPDRSEAAVKSLKEQLEKSEASANAANAQVEELENKNNQLETQTASGVAGSKSALNQALGKGACVAFSAMEHGVHFWTGIGVGIAGLIVTSVGGVLIAKMDKYEHTGFHEAYLSEEEAIKYDRLPGKVNIQDYKISSGYIAGWTLLGVGVTAAVAGIIVAGVSGYKMTHLDEAYSFGISPNGVSFGMTF